MAPYSHHYIAWSKELILALSEHRETWLVSTHRPIWASLTGGCNDH